MEQESKEEIRNRLQRKERNEGRQEIRNKEIENWDMIPTSRKHLQLVNWRFGLNIKVSKPIHMSPASILKQNWFHRILLRPPKWITLQKF